MPAEWMTPANQIEEPIAVGESDVMDLSPAITKKELDKDKAEKLAKVMDTGENASSPFGILGSAMSGYADSGGTWGSLGDDLKYGLGKLKGMFGG
ncbi:MAG: hypothetical protein J7K75_03010 [Desulfuromonas sp.]|nr:hypothetical protein [Desulfuromonas sp.]